MKANTPAKKEEIRHGVRKSLYDRQRTAHLATTVLRDLRADQYDADLEDVEAALSFLEDLEQVASEHGDLGSTKYFRLTASGILAHERSDAM
jgi:hypothetical protein